MNVGFIGNGRICRAFSAYISGHGAKITGKFGKNDFYSDYSRGEVDVKNLVQLAESCDILFITTPDDTISHIAGILAASGAQLNSRIVAHMSGSLPSGEMSALSGKCGGLYSLHPMTSITGEPLDFSKVRHTLEGEGENEHVMLAFLSQSNLFYTRISAENKLLYHAASCICANYAVTLIDIAQQILKDIGFNDDTAPALLMPLMRQVLTNVEKKDPAKALTGPISRGDINTLAKHLAALGEYGRYEDLYRLLGIYTADLSLAAGNITNEKAEEIQRIMRAKDK